MQTKNPQTNTKKKIQFLLKIFKPKHKPDLIHILLELQLTNLKITKSLKQIQTQFAKPIKETAANKNQKTYSDATKKLIIKKQKKNEKEFILKILLKTGLMKVSISNLLLEENTHNFIIQIHKIIEKKPKTNHKKTKPNFY
jgi:hypothetical protein